MEEQTNKLTNLEELRSFLLKGKVKFIFDKKDGSKREALGTLNEKSIPIEMLPKEDHVNAKANNFKYFDIEKNGWRSLSSETKEVEILSII